MSRIFITDVGRQVAISGLLPETADELLQYVSAKGQALSRLVEGDVAQRTANRNTFDFYILFACFASSEFSGKSATRGLHYGLGEKIANPMLTSHFTLLSHTHWQPYRNCANAASLLLEWVGGVSLGDLDGRVPFLRAGKIRAMARDAAWCLTGFTEILAAATRPDIGSDERPISLRMLEPEALACIRSIIPSIRLLTWRLAVGFPAEILWMSELKDDLGHPLVKRFEGLSLFHAGLHSYDVLRLRTNWPSMISALTSVGVKDAHPRAQKIQEGAHAWHKVLRSRTAAKLIERSPQYSREITEFFEAREIGFQRAFETLLRHAKIDFVLFDDGYRRGAFDYLIRIENRPDFIVECKTKQGDALVDLNEARSVLSAASQFGLDNNFCITLCNPGVNPDVLGDFSACAKLAIAETHDVAIALMRVISGKLTTQGFHDWMCQPGLLKAENIYVHSQQSKIGFSVENDNEADEEFDVDREIA